MIASAARHGSIMSDQPMTLRRMVEIYGQTPGNGRSGCTPSVTEELTVLDGLTVFDCLLLPGTNQPTSGPRFQRNRACRRASYSQHARQCQPLHFLSAEMNHQLQDTARTALRGRLS
jgi:hypothetical protein